MHILAIPDQDVLENPFRGRQWAKKVHSEPRQGLVGGEKLHHRRAFPLREAGFGARGALLHVLVHVDDHRRPVHIPTKGVVHPCRVGMPGWRQLVLVYQEALI